MRSILESHPGLAPVLDRSREHRLQAVLGLIEEDADGRRTLVQHGYRLGKEYFYPASTVKLFAATAALEALADLRRETGLGIDADTPLIYHPLFSDEVEESADPSNLAGGKISVRHEIRKLFLVSDNQAFNRLYELVGQSGLAASLARAGLEEARVVHRLSERRTAGENRKSPRIDFLGAEFTHTLGFRSSGALPQVDRPAGLTVGRGYRSDGELVETPMDFSRKNHVSLADLQRGLCMVVAPGVGCGGPGFDLSPNDRELLLEAMRQYPGQSDNPVYDSAQYPDDYVKFLLPGLRKVVPDDRLEIYNKVGQAYGFSTENAWVVDRETGRSFFLAATLYTNEDGILNDDQYEYEDVALPFLADLGEAVARHLWDQPKNK